MSNSYLKRSVRNAVTLVEVIFSIGVVLIGLLGLLSILPLAGKRAQDSISLSVAPVIANNVQAELLASKYLSNDRLGAITFAPVHGVQLPPPAPEYTVQFPSKFPITYYKTTLSPNTPDVIPSFCIDPMFASLTGNKTSALDNATCYFNGCFPYYKQNFDPSGNPLTIGSASWPSLQPRMFRVGVTGDSTSDLKLFINRFEALRLTENQDDLLITRGKDKSRPATFKSGQVAPVAGGLEYGKRLPSGEYTWIATVNPMPGGVYASVSVAIIRRRVRGFDKATPTANKPAVSERLAYVTYASGFKGGAGGIVHLVANTNVPATLQSGDWIMLSRFMTNPANSLPNAPDRVIDLHRWYRVVSVDSQAEQVANTNTWRLKVTLEGPDWNFKTVYGKDSDGNELGSYVNGYADTPDSTYTYRPIKAAWLPYFIADGVSPTPTRYSDNTYATMVEGVVSVTERVVKLSDL